MPDIATMLLERATAAVDLAKASGADHVQAGASWQRNVEYSLRDGTLEKVQEDVARSVGISLYVDGRYSRHSTSDLRPESLKGFVAEAIAMTRVLAPDPDRALPDASLYPKGASPDLGVVDTAITALDRDARMAHLQAIQSGLSGHDDIISWTAGISDSETFSAVVNTNGLSGTHHRTSAWSGAEVAARASTTCRRPRTLPGTASSLPAPA